MECATVWSVAPTTDHSKEYDVQTLKKLGGNVVVAFVWHVLKKIMKVATTTEQQLMMDLLFTLRNLDGCQSLPHHAVKVLLCSLFQLT